MSEQRKPFIPVEEAVEEIRRGRMVVLVDDEDRENEGDLTMAAEKITPEAVRPLDKIRGVVVALWKAEQRKKQAQARANGRPAGYPAGRRVVMEENRQFVSGLGMKAPGTCAGAKIAESPG